MTAKKSDPKPAPLPPNLQPQGKMPPTPTFHERPVRWILWHWWAYHRRRGKLVCPCCGCYGQWNAYGLYWKDRDVRRFLCKWCGFYDGTDGRYWCAIDATQGCWVKKEKPDQWTPQEKARAGGFGYW